MKSPVNLKYLRKVIFRSKCDLKRAINDFGESNLFEINRNMFNCNNNFVRDYKVVYNELGNGVEVRIRLNNYDFSNYQYSYVVVDSKNNEIKTTNRIIQENPDKQVFVFLIEGYNRNWTKVKFYINDILCLEESLEHIKQIVE